MQTLLNKRLYKQKFIHTEIFKHRNLYTQKFLNTDVSRRCFTQTFHADVSRRRFTQTFHNDVFRHKSFYTQNCLFAYMFNASTYKLLHTNAFTNKKLHTHKICILITTLLNKYIYIYIKFILSWFIFQLGYSTDLWNLFINRTN